MQSLNESEFFQRNALLFASNEEVQGFATQFAQAQALFQVLNTDPTLRGLVQALTFGLAGLQRKMYTLDDMTRPLTMVATTLEDVVAGRPASFSWRELVNRKPPTPSDLRRFILIKPVLDFTQLEPGAIPVNAIRQAASDLKLASDYRARVRLTGSIPIQDEEFGTLKEHWELNTLVSLGFLIGILWLALGSARIIVAVLISIFSGLAMTAAVGLWLVGSLNPISIAFAVLFVGIGIDFGIQFGVRYRAERYEENDLRKSLSNAARHVGVPLTLAAAATAAGFMSFLPTHYKGLSELGLIAGLGMIIAYAVSITLLPALLKLFNPTGEKEPLGYASLAPVDSFMERHRIADHRRHGGDLARRTAPALLSAVRLQSDEPPQPEGRIGRDVPRAQERSERGSECDRRAHAKPRGRAPDRRPPAQGPRGQRRHDARYLCAERPGAKADLHPARSPRRLSRPSRRRSALPRRTRTMSRRSTAVSTR